MGGGGGGGGGGLFKVRSSFTFVPLTFAHLNFAHPYFISLFNNNDKDYMIEYVIL